jgi:hypothetical protein
MLFTSCLCSSRVPKSADFFLLLPRRTRNCQFLGSSRVRAMTQAWSLDGRTGDRSGEPSPALRAGDVLAQRGGERRGVPAAPPDICRPCRIVPCAVPATVPAGGAADEVTRASRSRGAGILCRAAPPAKAPADGRRLRTPTASQREAIVLTFCLDLGPRRAIAARQDRGHATTPPGPGQRHGPFRRQTPEGQPYRDRQCPSADQASRAGCGPAVPARPSAGTAPDPG